MKRQAVTVKESVRGREMSQSKAKNVEKETETRRGVVLHHDNPFMSGAGVQTRTRRITNKRGDMMLVNRDGVIQSEIAGFWESEEVDSTKFVKLFVNGVKALAELTSAGTKVFELLYIEMQTRIGKDQVYLSYTALDEDRQLTISRATYKRGLSELIEKRFLAAMPAVGWYWVNPDFIWNGDRLAFVKEYKRKVISKDEQIREELEQRGQQRLIE